MVQIAMPMEGKSVVGDVVNLGRASRQQTNDTVKLTLLVLYQYSKHRESL